MFSEHTRCMYVEKARFPLDAISIQRISSEHTIFGLELILNSFFAFE